MKRGPSKGYASSYGYGSEDAALTRPSYIKELAERLNALEGQIHPHHGQQTNAELQLLQQQVAEAAAAGALREAPSQPGSHSSALDHSGRKRTHLQSEGFLDTPTRQTRPAPYGNTFAEGMRPSPYPASLGHAPAASMQPPQDQRQQSAGPGALQPFFKYGADTGRRESVSTPYDSEPSTATGGTLVDWDEEVVDEYVAIPISCLSAVYFDTDIAPDITASSTRLFPSFPTPRTTCANAWAIAPSLCARPF